MCATACTSAALPCALPRPRCGRPREEISRGNAGRPGGPMGSGAGADVSGVNLPSTTACQVAAVRRIFSAGSAQSRQAFAAACRSGRAALVLGIVRTQGFLLGQEVLVQARDVFTGEARRIEVLEVFVTV